MPGVVPKELLDAAELLTSAGAEGDLLSEARQRRATSTAYYAVFHAITARVAQTVFATADEAFARRVRRWIGHGDVATVARWASQLEGTAGGSPPAHIQALLAPADAVVHVDADTVLIADGFLALLDRRERADYDHDAVFYWVDTNEHTRLARQVVEVVESAESDAAKRFFGLVGMQARVQQR
ncbi:MAG: hypothetical protein M3417_13840 [Actinomycetota bacterium]|nr:hypothetical protein [Actinomycetota bacterium]